MIDLHSHILPGIDDGARDLDESVAMCQIAAADGASAIVATPHLRHSRYWNDDRAALEGLWRQLRARQGLGLEVLLGGEITVGSQTLEEIDQLPGGQLLTLCGGHYVLLELDWHGVGPDPLEMVHELGVLGWRPIIAHPERVAWLMEDVQLMHEMAEHGALFQLTAMSITGRFGSQARERSEILLDAGLAHFVASDAHDVKHRPPGLGAARAAVAERCGEAWAQALFVDHPLAVVEDRALPPLPPLPPLERSTGLGARIRRLRGH